MAEPNDQKAEAIFLQAREIQAPEARRAFLLGACGEGSALRERVEALLKADEQAAAFFDSRIPGEATVTVLDELAEGPGSRIGRYKLLEKIGEGGMGVVYMAEQTEPFQKRVALKIIKLGMDTKQVVARFEAERQALAMMNHPNIAKVIDGGSTETGRPYFVMELVRGISITEFCDKNRLSTRQRLELFVPVCQAVQHAHQKGIIHRDIKPSNVLVVLFDGKPAPMIIDFGIAKATNQRLTEKTLFTNFAQMMGTPAYMSPEQAEGSQLDIDTRTDVYSLGVLLYELLAGSPPFSEKRLRSAGWVEMHRILLEEDPPRPSNRLSTLRHEEESRVTGTHGGETPAKIGLLLKRELDWIIMRCLEKDRARRYETANGLAADVQRYLRGDAPEAAPPNWTYHLLKSVRKHRKAYTVGAATVLMMIGGSGVAAWQAIRAVRAEQEADRQAEEALNQSRQATAVTDFLVHHLLGQSDPWFLGETNPRDLSMRQAIDQAARQVESSFTDQPLVGARLQTLIGNSYLSVGSSSEGVRHLRRALLSYEDTLGGDDPKTLEIQSRLGYALSYFGDDNDAEEGEALLREAFHQSRQLLGPTETNTLEAMANLTIHYVNHNKPEEAEALQLPELLEEAERRYGMENLTVRNLIRALAFLRRNQLRNAETFQLYQRMADSEWHVTQSRLPAQQAQLSHAGFLRNYGHILWWWDRDFTEAEKVLLRALAIATNKVEEASPTIGIRRELYFMRTEAYQMDSVVTDLQGWRSALLSSRDRDPKLISWVTSLLAENLANIGHFDAAIRELETLREGNTDTPALRLLEWLLRQLVSEVSVPSPNPPLLPDPLPEGLHPVLLFHLAWALSLENADQRDRAPLITQLKVAENRLRPVYEDYILKRLLQGRVAALEGRWEDALEPYEIATHAILDRRLIALAHYELAMALHHVGRHQDASRRLQQAGEYLDVLLKPGFLITAFDPRNAFPMLQVLCARNRAEELILGRIESPPVTAPFLAERRARWMSVRRDIQRAVEMARLRQYTDAAAFLGNMIESEGMQESLLASGLFKGLELVFLNAGDTNHFVRFQESALAGLDSRTRSYFGVMVFGLDWLPDTLREQVTRQTPHWIYEEERPDAWYHWDLGVALFFQGEYEAALPSLENAMKLNPHPARWIAMTCAALAYHHLKQPDRARRYLQEVEKQWNFMLTVDQGRFPPSFAYYLMLDYLLPRARKEMGTG